MKIGKTYINIISNRPPYQIGLEFNKKTYYVESSNKLDLMNQLKGILNTSKNHWVDISNYILKSIE